MASKPLIKITFTPKDPGRRFTKILPKYRKKWKKIMVSFQAQAKELVKRNIPTRTGRTRRSITARRELNVNTTSGKIIISSRSNVLKFLDKGTKPSLGRFIPVLGRRIRTGTHPGIRGLNIIALARKDIENLSKKTVKDMKRAMKKSVRESFK